MLQQPSRQQLEKVEIYLPEVGIRFDLFWSMAYTAQFAVMAGESAALYTTQSLSVYQQSQRLL